MMNSAKTNFRANILCLWQDEQHFLLLQMRRTAIFSVKHQSHYLGQIVLKNLHTQPMLVIARLQAFVT